MAKAPLFETRRLVVRRLELGDAPFILELLNDPAFLQYIGDKGVRTPEEARAYLRDGPMASYARCGFGLYLVALRDGSPIGICGLLKREVLEEVDLGFAFLPEFRAQGYAFESAQAVLDHELTAHGLSRVLAITSPDNVASIALLEKLGFSFARMARLAETEPQVKLFTRFLGPP